MSVEFQPEDVFEASEAQRQEPRKQTLIHLAQKSGIEQPVQMSSDAGQMLDEEPAGDLDEAFHSLDTTGYYLKQTGRRALLTAADEVELAKDIEAGLYAAERLSWLKGEGAVDTRGHDKRDLQMMAERGLEARDHLVEANLRLVVSIAKRYTGRGMPMLDLVQEGNLGLIHAMEKFDYTKGYKFSTYATWWIRQAITRGIGDQNRTIRIPVHTYEAIVKLSKIERELHQDLGRFPTPEELAREMKKPLDKVKELLQIRQDTISLDMPVGDEESAPLGDLIGDDLAHEPAEAAVMSDFYTKLDEVLDTLEQREQEVIRLRFGLKDGQPRTLDQIGSLYGLSRERVRQIQREVMKKLRTGDRADKLRSFAEQ